jgi:hypothetical protein
MSTRIREIRVYRCEKCHTVVHDHAEPGGRFLDSINCAKCKRTMGHSTGTYSISTPDPVKHPYRRVAVRLPT